MPDGSADIKKGRKFDQVIAGARDVFLSAGFKGASVDDIAAAAGVSKATLYSYFPDKQRLFMEVARRECARQAEEALDTADHLASIPEALTDLARNMVCFLTSDFGQSIFRICVAEAERFPELGREFYESGPGLIHGRLVALFQRGVADGELEITDFSLAAHQFAELCKADLFPKLVFNLTSEFSAADQSRIAEGAVGMFLARYGTAAKA